MTGSGRPGAGRFITVEGIEGTGKTTQIRRLAERLRGLGLEPVVTREPGGTDLGRALRNLLLAPDAPPIRPLAELLLYIADRAQHLQELVLPALERGAIVVSDRYVDATLAYQGSGRGLDPERIRTLHLGPPLDLLPDRTILLDLDAGVALTRARSRDRGRGDTPRQDRFEQEELAFHQRVRQGYLELARAAPARIRVIDAGGAEEEVARRIQQALADVWPARGAG